MNRPSGGLSHGLDFRHVDLRQLAVASLSAVLDRFGLEMADFVANSMGGLWTWWFALSNPDRVRRIVQLGCPAMVVGMQLPMPMRLLSRPVLNAALVSAMVPATPEKAREYPKFLGHGDQTCAGLSDGEVNCAYWFPRLPTFRSGWRSLAERALTPLGPRKEVMLKPDEHAQLRPATLMIWGDHDPFGSIEVARRVAQATPAARLEILADTGHLPVGWWHRARSAAAAAALLAYAAVNLVGGSLSVLPLGWLPFTPEQTMGHYAVHVVYAACQVPLLILTVGRLVRMRSWPRARVRRRGQ